MKTPSYAKYATWALDFIRAFRERPKIFKWIAKIAMGKYAYRELIGIRDAFKEDDWMSPYMDYGLEKCDYHQEKVDGI